MLSASLSGIRVLDLTRLYPGPLCTLMLADLGADVIKVEAPEGEPGRYYPPYQAGTSAAFLQLNRGKRSLTLNLKSEKGCRIIKRLLTRMDVLVESFRPGVMKRLNLDFETLHPDFKSLIYCSISGYGQTGPHSNKPGHDINYISVAGLLSLATERRTETSAFREGDECYLIPPVQIADVLGAFQSVSAILAALIQRSKTGQGQYLDLSLLDGAFFSLIGIAAMHFAGHPLHAGALPLSGHLACYNIYRTRDGRYLALALLEPKFWSHFCRKLELEQFENAQFSDDQETLIRALSEKLESRTLNDWLDLFREDDLCISVVNEFPDALCDPQIISRNCLIDVSYGSQSRKHFRTPFVQDPAGTSPAPAPGEHNNQILMELGYTSDEIASLIQEGVL